MKRSRLFLLSVVLVASTATCSGRIESEGQEDEPLPSSPPAAGGRGASNTSANAERDPGRVTLRRLNGLEYNNTVRDLLATALKPAEKFLPDEHGFGFDNNGDVQTLTLSQLELYDRAAEALAADFVPRATAAGSKSFVCDLGKEGIDCAKKIVSGLSERAWRRPLSEPEQASLMAIITDARARGDDIGLALQLAVHAIVLSPHFLFKVEHDADPLSPVLHPLSNYELAVRLSYFLWSSMPDDALFSAARLGKLNSSEGLRAEAVRLLADARSAVLQDAFAGQWLHTRKLANHVPDPKIFPSFNESLRASMQGEMNRFFAEFVDTDAPLRQLLLAKFTFVDDVLAQHYGLPKSAAGGWRRVEVTDGRRGGLFGQAGILTVTSFPGRTSPPIRGAWVLDQLLCSPPPPPPPNVGAFPEPTQNARTVRERLEAHRSMPQCAGCHKAFDGIGFALENYSAIGGYRDKEGDALIDNSGELPDGIIVKGKEPLAQAIADDPRFPECATRNLMTFALGRGMREADQPYIDSVLKQAGADASLRDLILEVVLSEPFRQRRGEVPVAASKM